MNATNKMVEEIEKIAARNGFQLNCVGQTIAEELIEAGYGKISDYKSIIKDKDAAILELDKEINILKKALEIASKEILYLEEIKEYGHYDHDLDYFSCIKQAEQLYSTEEEAKKALGDLK